MSLVSQFVSPVEVCALIRDKISYSAFTVTMVVVISVIIELLAVTITM